MIVNSPKPNRENTAYFRYADKSIAEDEEAKYIFQHPGGEPLKIAIGGELYRMQKTQDHKESLCYSKDYIAGAFFAPQLTQSDLIALFGNWEESEAKIAELHDLIPRLGCDGLVELSLWLSVELHHNEKGTWRKVEDAILENLHLFTLQQTCQLMWAVTQLRPRQVSVRLLDIFTSKAIEAAGNGVSDPNDFHYIMQGHRNRKSKDLYMKMRTSLINKKEQLVGQGNDKQWAANLVNLFYSFVTNKPNKFGIYRNYAKDDLEELISVYEQDLINAAPLLN